MIVLHRQGLSDIAPVGGSLSGSVATFITTQSLNLTSLGTTDWAAFGYNVNATSIERKSTGGSKISTLTQVGAAALANFNFTGFAPFYSSTWTDGTPDASIAGENYGVYCQGVTAQGMSFTVPADTTSRTVNMYGGISTTPSNGKLTAVLSDGSASSYSDTSVSGTGTGTRLAKYTFTYSAASNAQTLTITWLNNSGSSQNVSIFAVTLQ